MTRTAIVVGAGFGGLAAAILLRREGVDVTVLERGDRVGGVWNFNTYPGAACDVPSHLYSYSFAPNPRWGRRFATQPDIQRYLEDTARRFGVLDRIEFGVDVADARWDDGRWKVDDREADLLIAACGQLQRPSVPAIEGIERFAGPAFHSSRWPEGIDLEGLRIGVVGTGASAIQLVPAIADRASRVTVFQRTAPWILPKVDAPYRGPAPGWAQRAARLGWWTALEAGIAGFVGHPHALDPMAALGRWHLRRAVADPDLRAKLEPHFHIGCKRILISNDWYPTLAREDVDLVTAPIARADATGLELADGSRSDLDVLVYGTGFEAREFVAPMAITGREGTLEDAWAGLPHAYHGLSVPGFPNFFLVYGPNTFGGSGSAVYMLESQARHIASAARELRQAGARTIEVRASVHETFMTELRERQRDTVWATGGCSSWYLDEQGRDPTNWPGYTFEYRRRTRRADPRAYALA